MRDRYVMYLESFALITVILLLSALALRGFAVMLIGLGHLAAMVLGT